MAKRALGGMLAVSPVWQVANSVSWAATLGNHRTKDNRNVNLTIDKLFIFYETSLVKTNIVREKSHSKTTNLKSQTN